MKDYINTMKKNTLSVVSKIVYETAKKEVNQACIFLGYQPPEPDSLMGLKVNRSRRQNYAE